MTTIRAYTDLQQSKKLAEILPLESADMYYFDDNGGEPNFKVRNGITYYYDSEDCLPCWSLTALLGVIPKHIKDYNVLRIDISNNDFSIWYDEIGFGVNNDLPDITIESAVDACYEMILKLHELKML